MQHCEIFNPRDVWFLKDNDKFFKRKIYVGVCPVCGKKVINFFETRKNDKKKFCDIQTSIFADRTLARERENIIYTANSVIKNTYGFCYGINRAKKSKKDIIYQQFTSDFYGVKKKILEYKMDAKGNKILINT